MSNDAVSEGRLVRRLLAAGDRSTAMSIARAARELANESTARAILDAFHRDLRERPARAGEAVRAAAALATVSRDKICRAIADRIAGIAAHVAGRPVDAVRRLERAARDFEAAGRWLDAGDVWRALIDVHMLAENDRRAGESGRRARKSYRRAGDVDARRLGSLAMNEGNVHHRRDSHADALAAYSSARRWFKRVNEPIRLANVDFNRANVLASLDRTAQARQLYESALAAFSEHEAPALVAQAEAALAVLDSSEGRLDDCVDRLAKVRKRQVGLGDRLGAAHSDLDAGEALLRMNRPIEADRVARSAERHFRKIRYRAEQALAFGLRGGAALQQGRAKTAARLFARGAELQRGVGNRIGAAILDVGRAQAESRAGDTASAIRLARGAIRAFDGRGLRSREARARAVGAEAARIRGRVRLARAWAEQALRLARAGRDARVELAALLVLARIEEAADDAPEAYRRLLAAERIVESMRRGVRSEESLLAFALDKSEVFEALVLNRLAQGGPRAAWQALVHAERGKSRALADRLADGRSGVWPAGSPRVVELVKRLREVERRLAVAESGLEEQGPTPGLRSARLAQVKALTTARCRTLELLRRSDPVRATLAGARPPSPRHIVESLDDDEIVLEYGEAGGKFLLFAVERNRIEVFPDLAPVETVRRLVELLQFQLGKGMLGDGHTDRFGAFIERAQRRYLTELHVLLLDPVAERLQGRRIRIIPHGVLHGLPFHALERDGVALIERSAVSYAPSLTVLSLLGRPFAGRTTSPLVLGVPDRSAPLIENEVERIRMHLGNARVFRGGSATRDALGLGQDRPRLLHVASHGLYSAERPWESGLLLGDAWFSLAELYHMQGIAELVVLSGCETGRGTVYSGDEWVGLVCGFLQAGARTVVASLWPIHDGSTVAQMDRFYAALSQGETVGQSLALAQRAARREDKLPLRWAPFVVLGDPNLSLAARRVAA